MKVAAYNPQVANCVGRWKLILLQFAALQVIGFSGTKQVLPSHLRQDTTVFAERIAGFDLFHWPCATTEFSNTSAGVSLALKKVDRHRVLVYSPPKNLQGRAGAIADFTHNIPNLHLITYLPVSGTDQYKRRCDMAIFSWLQDVVDAQPKKTCLFLYTDANARLGWQRIASNTYTRQDPNVIGALAKDVANVNGFLLAHF